MRREKKYKKRRIEMKYAQSGRKKIYSAMYE